MRIENWRFAFTGDWPVAKVLAAGIVGALLAWFFYRSRRKNLPGWYFALLVGLRVAALALLALFIMRPVVRYSKTQIEQAQVTVLVDCSKSMTINDSLDGRSRYAAAQKLLTGRDTALLRRLERSHSVKLFLFDTDIRDVEKPEELATVTPDGNATAIGDALKLVSERFGPGGTSAIVLLSDGVSTAGRDAIRIARTLGVPVFAVGLGSELGKEGRFIDVGVKTVPVGRDFIVNNKADVRVVISNQGLDGMNDAERLVQVVLKEEGKQVAVKLVLLSRYNASREVELEFVPKTKGVRRYEVEVPVLKGEAIIQNNRRQFTMRITDPKIRVLYVEGVVRSEYKFLRRTLESDPNAVFTGVIKTRADRFLVQGTPPQIDLTRGLPVKKEDYKNFDVVILGDIAASEFTPKQIELLKGFVSDGGGMVMLGGYHSFGPGGWKGTPFEEVLPVVMGGPSDGHVDREFQLKLTEAGTLSPIFAGCADFFKTSGKNLGLLGGCNRVKAAKPGSEVLGVHPSERTVQGPLPVVVTQRYGSGRVMALGADTTWRWKFQVSARGLDSPYYRFWGQTLRWLGNRQSEFGGETQQLAAWTSKPQYNPGEDIILMARVRNKDGSPEDAAVVEAEITPPKISQKQPEIQRLRLLNVPLSQGEYESSLQLSKSGIYKLFVTATIRGKKVGDASAEFIIGKPTEEFDNVDMDEQLLRSLAEESGGKYFTALKARQIPEELEARRKKTVDQFESNIWNRPFFCYGLFLGFVALEWILRKRRHLV